VTPEDRNNGTVQTLLFLILITLVAHFFIEIFFHWLRI
jgi:hypothetical protein